MGICDANVLVNISNIPGCYWHSWIPSAAVFILMNFSANGHATARLAAHISLENKTPTITTTDYVLLLPDGELRRLSTILYIHPSVRPSTVFDRCWRQVNDRLRQGAMSSLLGFSTRAQECVNFWFWLHNQSANAGHLQSTESKVMNVDPRRLFTRPRRIVSLSYCFSPLNSPYQISHMASTLCPTCLLR